MKRMIKSAKTVASKEARRFYNRYYRARPITNEQTVFLRKINQMLDSLRGSGRYETIDTLFDKASKSVQAELLYWLKAIEDADVPSPEEFPGYQYSTDEQDQLYIENYRSSHPASFDH